MPRKIQRYGWIPDLPDHRDLLYTAPSAFTEALPLSVDLRAQCPPVYDQGQLGSCTANAIGAALEFDQMKENHPNAFVPSRLFIYYNERTMEGTPATDSGAQIRDGIKCVNQQGACPETEWPYDITQFAIKPSDACYADALNYQATAYQSVAQNLTQMKGCLAAGYPFVFGFTVYDSFESDEVAKTGIVPMPSTSESVLGGHAVMAVGYDESQKRFIFRNSWGASWAQGGYGTIPYAYLTQRNLSSDFWTIRMVK